MEKLLSHILVFTTLLLLLASCTDLSSDAIHNKAKSGVEQIKEKIYATNEISKEEVESNNVKYNALKERIQQDRYEIRNRELSKTEKIELSEKYLSKILIDSIFEYWSGTKWDFNGHTKRPKDGEIACGYYITTTLKDAGIELNRIKLAQQASSEIIKQLCDPNSIKTYSKFDSLSKYLAQIENNEILIVGLDYHTGFLFKRDNQSYFAHSNYIDRSGVVKELVQDSDALKSSNIFMIGKLTKNKKLMEDWLN